MNDYKNFCEYTVKPRPTAKTQVVRGLLIAMYSVFTLLYLWLFWLNFKSWALLILLPFLMFAIIRVTWRLVNIEYEFAIEVGELKIAVIYGSANRRTKRRLNIPDMTLIAPYRADLVAAPDIIETVSFAEPDSENAYVCVYPDKKSGKKKAVIIETTEESRRILRLCNPSAFRK